MKKKQQEKDKIRHTANGSGEGAYRDSPTEVGLGGWGKSGPRRVELHASELHANGGALVETGRGAGKRRSSGALLSFLCGVWQG